MKLALSGACGCTMISAEHLFIRSMLVVLLGALCLGPRTSTAQTAPLKLDACSDKECADKIKERIDFVRRTIATFGWRDEGGQ